MAFFRFGDKGAKDVGGDERVGAKDAKVAQNAQNADAAREVSARENPLAFGAPGRDARFASESRWEADAASTSSPSESIAAHTKVGGWDTGDGETVESGTSIECGAGDDAFASPLTRTLQARRTVGFFLTRQSTGECFEVTGTRFALGKSREASYQLRGNPAISRIHAILSVDGDECWIEDNGSTNGTFVDGAHLAPHVRVKLAEGATITLGDDAFLLRVRVL